MLRKWIKKNVFKAIFKLLPLTLPVTLADALMLLGIRSFVKIIGGNVDWSVPEWFFCMVLVVALRFSFSKIRAEVSETFFRKAGAILQAKFLKMVRSLRPDFFHQKEADAKLRASFEATEILSKSGESLYQALQAVVQLFVFFPVLLFISLPLTLFLFCAILPFVVLAQKKIRQMSVDEKDILEQEGMLRSEFENAKTVYQNWSDIAERKMVGVKIFERVRHYFIVGKNLAVKKYVLALLMESVSVLAMLLVLSTCAFMISNGSMTGEDLVLYASAVFLCYKPIKECAKAFPQLRSAKASFCLLEELENYPRKNREKKYGDSLVLQKISFAYGETFVFENFSWKEFLHSEKPLFLHGENGVGKSTLLRLLSSLEEKATGEILLPECAKEGVFFFSQNLFLPPLEYFSKKFSVEKLQAKGPLFKKFMEESNVLPLLKKSGFSGGETARLALFLALVSESKLVLLDEVFAYVSLTQKEKMMALFLDAIKEENKLLILSGHNTLPETLSEKFEHFTLKPNNAEESF